jgi:NTE family protein
LNRRQILVWAAGSALGAVTPKVAGAAPRIALVLGGGGCRAHGHIGVIRALEKNGFKPDLVVGTSAGSFVGALYAAGMTSDQLERLGHKLGSDSFRDWIIPRLGLFGGKGIRRFVTDNIGMRTIESLPTRFAAVATELRTGQMAVFERGEVGLAVQASSSVPGLIEPLAIGEKLYVDGSLVAPVPVKVARRLGANRVVAVDVTFPPEEAILGGPYDALYQGFSIVTRRLALDERATADVLIAPRLPVHNDMESATMRALVQAGEQSANAAMTQLRAVFSRST